MSSHVIVITGAGGMGLAVARRITNGRRLVLADYSTAALEVAAKDLRDNGYDIITHTVDVSKLDAVQELAKAAVNLGQVDAVVHTAGVSPVQASPQQVLEVDLVGTANVLDSFYEIASPGLAMVCIASMAGHLGEGITQELERHLATAPTDKLLDHPEIDNKTPMSYAMAKKGNILRVKAAAKLWGNKGARVNTISPGIIATAMGKEEFEGPGGDQMRHMLAASAAGKEGNAEDIANIVAFLVGPESRYITGTDFLVDGGMVAGLASQRWAA
ncbi:unnamed protein product [Clonostachys rhizophaga]|uniref:Uncharacterized protein n=1 Tax=Clonostachys rhizophaga TaxID=160324 RepID=A0A9N9V8D1_9HYPO|nr:unnamed protein product [Clonostachys rhizophaga]